MSASFYDLLKFAKTGVASPSMTAYDKQKALAMCKAGFPVKTLTGVPPISFQSDGSALTAWSISGNKTQSQETGDRTANLLQLYKSGYALDSNGNEVENSEFCIYQASVSLNDLYYILTVISTAGDRNIRVHEFFDNTWLHQIVVAVGSQLPFRITKSSRSNRILISIINSSIGVMLAVGHSILPYEPYGYKLPIILAGQTQTIYLSEPLRKALDGSDAVDVLRSDGTLTREVDSEGNALQTPTTETVTVPTLTPTKGSNTLTVGTTLQPSSVSITGGIK